MAHSSTAVAASSTVSTATLVAAARLSTEVAVCPVEAVVARPVAAAVARPSTAAAAPSASATASLAVAWSLDDDCSLRQGVADEDGVDGDGVDGDGVDGDGVDGDGLNRPPPPPFFRNLLLFSIFSLFLVNGKLCLDEY